MRRVNSPPLNDGARTLPTCFGWTLNPHEENRFGGFGDDTSASYAEMPPLLMNKLTLIRLAGTFGGSRDTRRRIRAATL